MSSMAVTRWSLLALAVAAGAARMAAQTFPPVAVEAGGATKRAAAVRLGRTAIRLDGRLDDAAWRSARWITDFVQKEPNEGAEPTERTEVAFLYDDAALYVAARMYSNDPSRIQAPLTRRDVGSQSEHLWISLDTYRDRRTAYSFGLTAAGTRMDWFHPRDHEYDIDGRFDPVWEGKAVIDSLGWTAEMRIPFSQLRFTARDEQVWGLNIDRWIPARNEDVFWIPVPKNETGWSSRMGELHGIAGIAPSRRIELLPYAASNATLTREPDPADPFDDGVNLKARAGADLKVGLGSNLTLDATINPDFGQVEADPAVVNLSAFEVFFDERRPFFTEGSQLLSSNFFYSRRIGAAPRGRAPSGDFVDYPAASTILGAAKVTGRLPGGLSITALGAVTGREHARAFDTVSAATVRRAVAPATAFGALRGLQEFGRNASTVGLTATWVRRDIDAASGLDTVYAREALSGRVDWNLRFARGTYVLGGNVGFTDVRGEPGDSLALARIQRSAVHYFQRPDADHVAYDSQRRSLAGHTASLFFEKTGGRHWVYEVSAYAESPGFDPNDAGRLGNADGRGAFAWVAWRETRPTQRFYSHQVSLETGGEWNYGGDRQFATTRLDARLTWRNYWVSSLTFWVDHPAQSHAQTRGGPSMGTPRAAVVIGQLQNHFGARTRWNARVYFGWDALGGETYRVSGGVSLQPSARLQVSANPNYLRSIGPRQYVATLDSGPAATDGGRYVFSAIDQTTLLVQLRASLAITPDLSFDLYAEPFAASGHYHSFGHLAAGRGTGLVPYATDSTRTPSIAADPGGANLVVRDGGGYRREIANPDFNLLSFRSNLVLRWEWRPGSTLFLVWQADRGAEDGRGEPVGLGDWWDAFGAPGRNVLALKVSYWIPVR